MTVLYSWRKLSVQSTVIDPSECSHALVCCESAQFAVGSVYSQTSAQFTVCWLVCVPGDLVLTVVGHDPLDCNCRSPSLHQVYSTLCS